MNETTKIGFFAREGSFSDRWISYCKDKGISYLLLNPFSFDFLEKARKLKAFLWHWPHLDPKYMLIAKHLTIAMEKLGILVFPDFNTVWHFDDKIAQKYLLESINAPFPRTWVFFDKGEALEWIHQAEYPLVFKLHTGAGSQNVRLVNNKKDAEKLCHIAFGKGFQPYPSYFADSKTKIRKIRSLKTFLVKLSRMPRMLSLSKNYRSELALCKGYIYFQEFLPNNDFDIRITIIGSRAFGFIRYNRPGDFRASGSGNIDYDLNKIDPKCIKLAFELSNKIKAQSLAYDFLKDMDGNYKVVEISYCYQNIAVYNCPGHWDNELKWHSGHLWPEYAILEDILAKI